MPYGVLLSNENDYLRIVENQEGFPKTWKSTQDKAKASKFETEEKATQVMRGLGVRMMWKEAQVIQFPVIEKTYGGK